MLNVFGGIRGWEREESARLLELGFDGQVGLRWNARCGSWKV